MTVARPGNTLRLDLDETEQGLDGSPSSATVDDLQLDLQVCFAVHATARAFDRAYRPLLAGLGLTYPQYLVMLVLWERPRAAPCGRPPRRAKEVPRRIAVASGLTAAKAAELRRSLERLTAVLDEFT